MKTIKNQNILEYLVLCYTKLLLPLKKIENECSRFERRLLWNWQLEARADTERNTRKPRNNRARIKRIKRGYRGERRQCAEVPVKEGGRPRRAHEEHWKGELSGYNPYNKDECFIQFATWRGDYVRARYSTCAIASLSRRKCFYRLARF